MNTKRLILLLGTLCAGVQAAPNAAKKVSKQAAETIKADVESYQSDLDTLNEDRKEISTAIRSYSPDKVSTKVAQFRKWADKIGYNAEPDLAQFLNEAIYTNNVAAVKEVAQAVGGRKIVTSKAGPRPPDWSVDLHVDSGLIGGGLSPLDHAKINMDVNPDNADASKIYKFLEELRKL